MTSTYTYTSTTSPSARVIADSIEPFGKYRLTTMEVVMPRMVLAEFNTHRKFSRSSASSRAIPTAKQLRRVLDDPFMPLEWGSNQPGMQAGDQVDEDAQRRARLSWLHARDKAVEAAQALEKIGVHKQITNRLIEPFMWHTVIVSSTEWDNFFSQRCSPLAQPEIRITAEAMLEALNGSTPTMLTHGEWHVPYIQDDELYLPWKDQVMLSTARCARVSYLNHEGKRDLDADISLYKRLVTADPPHASPLEHVARPALSWEPVPGNFDGFKQLRHDLAMQQAVNDERI